MISAHLDLFGVNGSEASIWSNWKEWFRLNLIFFLKTYYIIETEVVVFRRKAIQYWCPIYPIIRCIGDKLVSIVLIYPDVWGWPPSFVGANALFKWS